MDNLIYDLQHNKKLARTIKKRSAKPEFNSHNKKMSKILLLNKRKKLMKVLIATAAAAAAASVSDSTTTTNLLFKDLCRIKRFNKIHHLTKKQQQHQNLINKKKKSSFRIQKTYRFRNYRLRCIRLRQSQLKERRRQFKSKSSSFTKRSINTTTTTNNNNNRMSSSCVESSDSNLTASSNNNISSSSSSSEETTLSLVECFKQTKFLNSSDTREEDAIGDNDLKSCSKSSNLKNKKQQQRIHCVKHTKSSFKKKLSRLGNKSLMIKENRYLNLKKTQLICDCHYCNHHSQHEQQQQQQNHHLNLNKLYLKRKRFTSKETTSDETKKLKSTMFKCIDDDGSPPDYSSSAVQSSGDDMMKDDDLVDSSIKSGDESNESLPKKVSLKTTTPTITSLKFKNENNISSNEEEDYDDLDDTGADDEQSDWPANENTCYDHQKLYMKSANQLINVSSSQIVDFNEKNSFKIIPWWNENDSNEHSLVNRFKSNQSNYEKMNENIESDNSEFDQLFNGGFNLISSSSKRNFHDKMNKSKSNRNKLRSTSLSIPQEYVVAKSSSSADDANKPLGEENKGNKMLQQMGWIPGTSLGLNKNENSLINPIVPVKRPHRIGLGFQT